MNKQDTPLQWKSVEQRVIFRNKYIGLRNDKTLNPKGEIVDYAVIENRDFASVVCITPSKQIHLIRQYRYPWQAYSWEIPSGLIEPDETPEKAAIRELKEETGISVKSVDYLLKCHLFGLAQGWCYLYYVEVDSEERVKPQLDPNEFLYHDQFPIEKIKSMIKNGDIIHAPSLLGLTYAFSMNFI